MAFPSVVSEYGGDVLYTTNIVLFFGWIFIDRKSILLTVYSILLSYVIEVFQLYHSPFIDELRRTLFGKLILGSGFLWSDMLCYTIGGLIGYTILIGLKSIGDEADKTFLGR